LLLLIASAGGGAISAQTSPIPQLPDAPKANLLAENNVAQTTRASQSQSAPPENSATVEHLHLTRAEAEQMAIKNNPRISVGRLLALAQHQVVRETRSAELPTLVGSITAEDAKEASHISAGTLNASRLFEHAGAGSTATQLITDFGRTRNLVLSSKLQEKAQNASALATTEDIVLATDRAFYNALQAQALLNVAEQNVTTRQTTDT
jgi:outer membrane protein